MTRLKPILVCKSETSKFDSSPFQKESASSNQKSPGSLCASSLVYCTNSAGKGQWKWRSLSQFFFFLGFLVNG